MLEQENDFFFQLSDNALFITSVRSLTHNDNINFRAYRLLNYAIKRVQMGFLMEEPAVLDYTHLTTFLCLDLLIETQ